MHTHTHVNVEIFLFCSHAKAFLSEFRLNFLLFLYLHKLYIMFYIHIKFLYTELVELCSPIVVQQYLGVDCAILPPHLPLLFKSETLAAFL